MRLSYAEECGPAAVAAVLGLSRVDAARRLWPHRLLWGEAARLAAPGTHGTPERALQDVLLRHGCGLDLYDGDGALVGDTAAVAGLLRRQAHDRVAEVRRGGQPPRRPPLDDESPESPDWYADLLPLPDWLERHRAGYWLYMLTDVQSAHVIATWGPKVLAGDDKRYRRASWRVYEALRIHQGARA